MVARGRLVRGRRCLRRGVAWVVGLRRRRSGVLAHGILAHGVWALVGSLCDGGCDHVEMFLRVGEEGVIS
jgi:hypothetical protein